MTETVFLTLHFRLKNGAEVETRCNVYNQRQLDAFYEAFKSGIWGHVAKSRVFCRVNVLSGCDPAVVYTHPISLPLFCYRVEMNQYTFDLCARLTASTGLNGYEVNARNSVNGRNKLLPCLSFEGCRRAAITWHHDGASRAF